MDLRVLPVHEDRIHTVAIQHIQFGLRRGQAYHLIGVGVFQELGQNHAIGPGAEYQNVFAELHVQPIHGVNAAGHRLCHASFVKRDRVRNLEQGIVLHLYILCKTTRNAVSHGLEVHAVGVHLPFAEITFAAFLLISL